MFSCAGQGACGWTPGARLDSIPQGVVFLSCDFLWYEWAEVAIVARLGSVAVTSVGGVRGGGAWWFVLCDYGCFSCGCAGQVASPQAPRGRLPTESTKATRAEHAAPAPHQQNARAIPRVPARICVWRRACRSMGELCFYGGHAPVEIRWVRVHAIPSQIDPPL